jgi:hypothetical protein
MLPLQADMTFPSVDQDHHKADILARSRHRGNFWPAGQRKDEPRFIEHQALRDGAGLLASLNQGHLFQSSHREYLIRDARPDYIPPDDKPLLGATAVSLNEL